MSKINDKLIQAEEWPDDEQMQKWREETRKLHELDAGWVIIYNKITGKAGNHVSKNTR